MASRILFFLLGVIALAVGALISIGAGLVGALAIAVAGYALKRRSRRLTRRGAWLWSVAGTVSVLAVFMTVVLLKDDTASKETPAQRAERRERATQAMPDWLKTINPNAQRQSQAADSMAAQLMENRAVMLWAGIMGAVIASAVIGTIAGSFVWGGVMLLYRGFRGRWLGTVADPGLAEL